MTIQLHLPPDLVTKLRQQAAAAGKDLETFAIEALREKIATSNGPPQPSNELAASQRVSAWLSWTASHHALGWTVDDDRESIYAGRGE